MIPPGYARPVSRRTELRAILVRVGFAVGRRAPLRSGVLLATGHLDRVTGNLAWIRDELRREQPEIPIVEFAHRAAPGAWQALLASVWSVRAGYLLATTRLVVVDDYFFPMYVIQPRRGTTFVQVWHACGALKRFGYSLGERTFGAGVRQGSIAIHSNYDLCLVSAARFAPYYAEAFGTPPGAIHGAPRHPAHGPLLRCRAVGRRSRGGSGEIPDPGRPPRRPVRADVPRRSGHRGPLAGPAGPARPSRGPRRRPRRPAASAPVRGSLGPGGDDLADFVIDVSDHPDMNALLLVSDVLVTDYSSVIFEFALLGRPMVFFAPDRAAYEAERGLYVEYESFVPGPVFSTTEAVASHIRGGAADEERVRRFAAASFDVADGRASARFVREVVLPALGRTAPEPASAGAAAAAGEAAQTATVEPADIQ